MKDNTQPTTKRELTEGINGRGAKVWVLATILTSGSRKGRVFIERFETEAEARHWMKWA